MEKQTTSNLKMKYVYGGQTMLNEVKEMWENLNLYHCDRSEHFKPHYKAMTFAKRKATLLRKAEGGELRVDMAIDKATGKSVGYIVSTIRSDNIGEIESVYVDAAYRRMGIGGVLIRAALSWMEQKAVSEKVVEVSVGNETAWGFYGRFGFKPRLTLLKQVKQ
jgi:ribosomal protein S18 acetylase RimI-like enzyme